MLLCCVVLNTFSVCWKLKRVEICGFDVQYQRLVVGRGNVYVVLFESPNCLHSQIRQSEFLSLARLC